MKLPRPMMIAALAAVAVLLVVAVLLATRGSSNQDRLIDAGNDTAEADDPESRCSSRATYDAIKTELFRQAARARGSDQAAFDRIAAYSVLRIERPVLRSDDPDLRSAGCAAVATLDLPPGLAVVGGRRSLSAQIGYIVQPAADGSGEVVMLEGAEPIIVPLATLARTPNGSPLPTRPEPQPGLQPEPGTPPATGELPAPAPPPPAPAQPPAPPPSREPERASASPSFNCSNARTRGEIAVCRDPELAALDRQMSRLFFRELGQASPEQRRILQSTRARFLRYRDSCRNDGCIAGAYRGRIREINDIMAGRWRPTN
jgi:hypothetical protein